MTTSIFELFKIGIGPSSSHTVGPMHAARSFAAELERAQVARVQVELYGSLGLTGQRSRNGSRGDPGPRDLLFRGDIVLPGHPNGMRFSAFDAAGATVRQQVYYSVGDGFVEREGQKCAPAGETRQFPYPFSSAAEMLEQGAAAGLPVWAMVLENEKVLRSEPEIRARIVSFGVRCRRAPSAG